MSDQSQFWNFVGSRLDRGETVALLTVTESTGSSPGRPGFKMAVAADGMTGSVGGGVMEVSLVETAREMLTAAGPNRDLRVLKLVHRPNVPNSSGMICSGTQTVVLARVTPEDLPAIMEIRQTVANGGEVTIGIGDDGLRTFRTPDKAASERYKYVETIGRRDTLYVVGGGHCALALSELMSRLGFRIALFDDRADLNTIEKNSFADEKTIVASYEEIAAHIPEGEDVFVVVMTLGYKFDETVIRSLFGKRFRYFGVLGSRAKMKTLLNGLRAEGFDDGYLRTIRTPIGLRINSRTPEEIAVSIAAEIISVRNSGRSPINN